MGSMRIKLPTLTCERCGHSWTPRRPVIYQCPKCKNPRWNEPKTTRPRGTEER